MTVSHIGVTVSHLPTSCSFYLAALQPLGYRFVGQQGSQIGLGINDADFFLCQETSSVKAGSAHIAFTAPSRTSVRDFYTAALNSGARPNGAPASRTEEDGHFNAAILDPDGNSVEVVFKNGPDLRDDGTVIKHSRVITWQRTVTDSYQDDRTVRSSHTLSKAPPGPSLMTVASKAASMARSVSEPTGVPQAGHAQAQAAPNKGDSGAKTIIGTLIGAAAGAAVVYAMVKSEQDSAQKESDFNALKQAKNMVSQFAPQFLGTNQQPQQMDPQPQPVYEISPKPLHRSLSDTGSEYSAASAQRTVRAIEPAPSNYHSETYTLAPSRSEAPRSEYREPPRSEYSEYTEVSRREPQRSEPPRSEYREPPRSEYSEYTEVSRREPQRSEAPRSEYREARSEAPRSEYREARSEYSEASRSDASRDYAPSRNQKAVDTNDPKQSSICQQPRWQDRGANSLLTARRRVPSLRMVTGIVATSTATRLGVQRPEPTALLPAL
ncbi:hypothetical protein P280DRAFT_312998 [Massarina eburnea CBS 473.64]|uniref:VOC domain-containing protein n=1 Tax=Massarina eburnea CBS 473.64 TaxID=1395130 RepID=A0A6A6S2T3_9PLEO|nr:hypothetical protein P280DRAFT_312998 [Massarina eburnea CBS 473.64]